MLETLKSAILDMRRLEINYEPGQRIVEPHALGWSGNGDPLVRVYQVSGASASGEHEHWKLLRVDCLLSANDNGDCFDVPRPGYRRGDRAMKGGIIVEL